MTWANIWQRPVGQGGLCEGAVSAGGPPIRWVYDCGSNQTDRLEAELRNIGGDLDLLFLSHLDKDHVNGLDQLLMVRRVDEVVLPYLEDYERLLVLARAVAEDRLTGQFLTFMAGPVGWLRARGVNRVTFVRSSPDDGDVDGSRPQLPRDGSQKVEGRLRTLWSPELIKFSQDNRIAHARAGCLISLCGSSGQLADWIFLPFAQAPSKKLLAAFRAELKIRFPGLRATQIIQAVWSSGGRADLRACYDEIWGDHNLVSMSPYAGPAGSSDEWNQTLTYGRTHQQVVVKKPIGWLTTGDADLSGPKRRNTFAQFYEQVLDQVSVLVPPHHGAATSWHPAILNGMTNLRVGCAAAGPNGYGHPHQSVMSDLQAHLQTNFWQVSDEAASTFRLEAVI